MGDVQTLKKGEIALRDLSKSFQIGGRSLRVLRNVNLEIRSGECLAIVGASGSGKTTLLRILAGLDAADAGKVLIDNQPITGVGNERAVIFQEPRLLPWQTVLENVAFGLEVRGGHARHAKERARHYLSLVGLAEFADAYPKQLSGGMAQRVGIARALTVQPEILLLDEPFGALDAMTKLTMQEELERIWRDENVTMVLVTHDLEEAVYLADRVLVLPKSKDSNPKIIEIDLARPRDRSEPGFVRYRKDLLREFGLH
ncbi:MULTISPECIES: ABC transporter ATP-binding protein [unclassified Sinorhizobium]|uniref:ABC transporter ATP-binding protein n=1 Tax=unclassified Sinorhizobium TaxID=2613772 RepID=UPI0024C232BC|nr:MULTISPECIES: ABC transporter ATP-binding protein [unclassified Sinorhizobium]MDK1377883.1 ABC transporter ATP-binding protein [Sinorhizobium sp. 6-70]MDK1481446.1 ABC transporter ATP-binding protein [Sinorhizobium sp. 6-117]